MRLRDGDFAEAEHFAQATAAAGRPDDLFLVAGDRYRKGDRAEAERLYRAAADAGSLDATAGLALIREIAGDQEEAEQLASTVAGGGPYAGFYEISLLRENAGDHAGAGRFMLAANLPVLAFFFIKKWKWLGYRDHAEQLTRAMQRWALAAAAAGDRKPMMQFVQALEDAGDHDEAEELAFAAADRGHPQILDELARTRDETGNCIAAERLALAAADAGLSLSLWHLGVLTCQHPRPDRHWLGLTVDGAFAKRWW